MNALHRYALVWFSVFMRGLIRLPRLLLKTLIRIYQAVHPAFFSGSCRFYPTCSHYAVEAIETHGALKGTLLAGGRILRCQPFCQGGFDPVPPPGNSKKQGPNMGRNSETELGKASLYESDLISSEKARMA